MDPTDPNSIHQTLNAQGILVGRHSQLTIQNYSRVAAPPQPVYLYVHHLHLIPIASCGWDLERM